MILYLGTRAGQEPGLELVFDGTADLTSSGFTLC